MKLSAGLKPFVYTGWELAVDGSREERYARLSLPDEWTPSSTELPFELIVEAARAGVSIRLNATPEEPVDLRWFGDALPFVRDLELDGPRGSYTGLEALREMTSLERLRGPRTDVEVDLSHLPQLRTALLRGSGLLSAVAAPRIWDAYVDVELPAGFRLPPQLWRFSYGGPSLTAEHFSEATGLQQIWASEVDLIDFTGLRRDLRFEVVSITATRAVRGLDALLSATQEVRLVRVASLSPVSALLSAELRRCEITACPDVGVRLERELTAKGWYVDAYKPRRTKGAALRIVRGLDGAFEVVFDDWGLLADLMGTSVADELPYTSGEIEDAARLTLDRDLPGVAVDYDSEGDAVRILTASRAAATKVRDALEPLFRDRDLLAAAIDAARSSAARDAYTSR